MKTHSLAVSDPSFRGLARIGAVLALLALAAAAPAAAELDRGLVTALDRIGGNLLGPAAFDAVLQDPPDTSEPPALRIYLSEAQAHPVEVVLVTAPRETDPPMPDRAFFRMSVGGPEGLKLEFDHNAGEIEPCWLPPADLSGIPAAATDSGNGAANFRPGLVTALGEVGGNLLGAGQFDAVLQNPPDGGQPQRLRLFVSRTSRVEFVLNNPPDILPTFFRMLGGGEESAHHQVELQMDAASGRPDVRIEPADLSGIDPPMPD